MILPSPNSSTFTLLQGDYRFRADYNPLTRTGGLSPALSGSEVSAVAYAYDAANRLISITQSPNHQIEYRYRYTDPSGFEPQPSQKEYCPAKTGLDNPSMNVDFVEARVYLSKFGNYSAYWSKNHCLWQERPKSQLLAIGSRPKCGIFSPKLAYAANCWAFNPMAE